MNTSIQQRGTRKIYRGYRDGYRPSDPVAVTVQDGVGLPQGLPHIHDYKPIGFEWGYEGAGPKELARSILADYLGGRPHFNLYEDFVLKVLSKLDQAKPWVITSKEIERWLKSYQRRKDHPMFEADDPPLS